MRVAIGLLDSVFDGAVDAAGIDRTVPVAGSGSVDAFIDVGNGSGVGVGVTIASCTGVGVGCVAGGAASAITGVRSFEGCGVDPDEGPRMSLALSAAGAVPGCVLETAVEAFKPRLAFNVGVATSAGVESGIEERDGIEGVGVTESGAVGADADVSEFGVGAAAAAASATADVGVLAVGAAGAARAFPWSSSSIKDANPLTWDWI